MLSKFTTLDFSPTIQREIIPQFISGEGKKLRLKLENSWGRIY